MKKTALVSVMICSMIMYITACGNVHVSNGIIGKNIRGNGVLKEKERGRMDFNAINASGSVDVIIADVADAPIKVSGDENLIDSIETYVTDGVLNVHFRKGLNYSSQNGLKVIVPNNGKINKITASGSSDVHIEGCLVAKDIYISGRGSSDIKGNIQAENCELNFRGSSDFRGNVQTITCKVDCSGSSDCIISGSAEVCEASMSGSSDFKGFDFVVDKFTASASGSSDVQITCNGELSVRASGSSDVYYKGDAKIVSQHLSGSSDLKRR